MGKDAHTSKPLRVKLYLYEQKNAFMKSNLLFAVCLLAVHTIGAQNTVPVFTSGQEGHQSYRIPAVVALPDGDLLAFAEGRVRHAGDFGDVDIVVKRSIDRGKTWSALQVVVDYDSLQAGNPAPVVDRTDPRYPDGRLFLFYNTGNNHENEVRKGNGLREVWYVTSTDGGNTWSEPVNITTQVHRPNHGTYHFPEDWRSYANTPGHAIQLAEGQHRGRLYVAANHSAGSPQAKFEDYRAHGFYTDDHGQTFQLSEDVSIKGSNESMAVELPGGRLMMNIRNQQGDVRARIVALSSDGGQTWDTAYYDLRLPDPVCQGSILSLGKKRGKHHLVFCNPADTQYRNHLTLRYSDDVGVTWRKSMLMEGSTDLKPIKDAAAYSDLVRVGKKHVGVLYERDGYREIVFKALRYPE